MEKYRRKTLSLLKANEIDAFATSAAESYRDYPLFQYFIGKDYCVDAAKTILAASIKAMGNQAIGITSGSDNTAIAVFAKPNYSGTPAIPFVLNGGIKLAFKHSLSILLRLLNYENYAMQMKGRHAHNDCWYLYTLTVAPENQHKGLATSILQPMLDFLDATRQSCYLETHKDTNVALYEHYGFKLTETGMIPGTSVAHYAMLRSPCDQ